MKKYKEIMDEKAILRALTRISYEIIERNKGVDQVVLLGIKTRGVPLARKIAEKINEVENSKVEVDVIDITYYRDDLKKKVEQPVVNNKLNTDIEEKIVILVDDVIYTGRTCRAALEAIIREGRPSQVQLAVLIDRGHRELPIRPDYIGKNVPTSKNEVVHVKLMDIDNLNSVIIKTLN